MVFLETSVINVCCINGVTIQFALFLMPDVVPGLELGFFLEVLPAKKKWFGFFVLFCFVCFFF